MLSTLLEMSLAGGCLILVVIVLRALLLHRLPKALFFWLWMLALLRLLLPVFPASPLSVFARAPAAAPVVQQAAASAVGEGAQATRTEAGIAPAAAQAPPTTAAQTAPLARPASAAAPEAALMPALTCVWLAVALLLALLLGLVYARGLRIFRRARPLQSPFIRAWLKENALRRPLEVRLCPRIDSPMTYGLLRPVILLPESAGKADTRTLLCALEHELSHIRHFDAVWKLLIAVAVCLHWFNPLVWAMAILANRDIELCCDARVLRRGGKEERRAYASALLRMEEARARILPLTNAFSRNALEERIGAIMNAKKISITALLLTLLIVAVALTAFAAAPESGTATPPADREMTHAELVAAVDAAVDANAQYRGVSTSDLPAYAPYGLGALDGGLFYRGVRVRAFDDRAAGILALDTQGNVDVCAVRDENGALTGLRAATREEFDQNTMEEPRIRAHWFGMEASAAETYIAPPEVWPLPETEALRADIAAYAPYGLHDESGMIAFMDATVRSFADEAAGYDVLCDPNGKVDVSAVRDETGALTGLRATGDGEYAAISSQQWYSEDEPAGALVMQPMYTQEMKNNGLWIDDPDTAGGLNIAENGYANFGITTHQDLLLYDGEYVRYLEDAGANVHYENDGGTIDLYAVRDESGALTGFREATQEEYDANTKQYMAW